MVSGARFLHARRAAHRPSRAGTPVAVLLACTLLAACQPGPPLPGATAGPGAGPPSAPAEVRTLRMGILPAIDFLGFYAALDRGYLEEQGLRVELKVMAGGAEIMPALVGGSLDVGISNPISHALAREGGLDLKMIAAGNVETRARPLHAILVRPDSPIGSAAELGGKTIGINTLNNIDHVMVQEWLEKNGADPKRVNFLELPFPQHPQALLQGRFDVSAPTEPFVTVALGQGARAIARHYVEVSDRTQIAYFVATTDWIRQNPDLARRFAAAVHRGNEFAMQNEQEARAVAARQLKLDPAVAERVGLPELQTRAEPALLQWWFDAGLRRGLLKQAVDPGALLHDTAR